MVVVVGAVGALVVVHLARAELLLACTVTRRAVWTRASKPWWRWCLKSGEMGSLLILLIRLFLCLSFLSISPSLSLSLSLF